MYIVMGLALITRGCTVFGFTIKSTLSVFHVGVYIIRTEEDMSICGGGGVRGGRVLQWREVGVTA